MGSSRAQSVAVRLKEAVLAQVAEEGVAGLEVRAICVRAHASEAAFRERWPDAWAALAEAIEERARLPELPDTGALTDDLVAYARDHMAFCADRTFVAVLFYLLAEAATNATVRDRIGPGFADRRERNLIVIKRAIARGELAADVDGDAILDAILTMAMAFMGRDALPREEEIRCAVEALIIQTLGPVKRRREANCDPQAGDVYRLFVIDPSSEAPGRKLSAPELLQARSEPDAIALVNARRGGRYAELWKADKLIRIFDDD